MTTRSKETEVHLVRLAATIKELEAKRDEYVGRLDVGAAKIEEARSQGQHVENWESYWIQLLLQYEAVSDKLRDYNDQLATLKEA